MSRVIIFWINQCEISAGFQGEVRPRCTVQMPKGITQHSRTSIRKIEYLKLFNFIFLQKLSVKANDSRVVVVEDIFQSATTRDIIITVLLNILHVSSVSFQGDLFLPILTSCTTTGLVVSISTESSNIISIYQGRPLLHTLVGGNDIISLL